MSYTSWIEAVKSVGLGKERKARVWQTDSGNWAGERPDGSTQYGMKDKEKAQAYVAGKDVEVDEPEKEPEAEPEPEVRPEPKDEKEPLTPEKKKSLRTQDHKIADDQLNFTPDQMEEEVQKNKDIDAYSTDLSATSAEEISEKIKSPEGKAVVLPNEKMIREKSQEELNAEFDGETKDGKFYPKLITIKNAVNSYREENNLPTEGVGAGTAESRAGEVATHKALRMLAGQPPPAATKEEVRSYLMEKTKNSALSESWVDAGIAAAQTVIDDVGLDNIDEIAWDTPAGRQLVGVEGHGTSSDMFITTKDGQRIGISLKKDGNVFLANKGYYQEYDRIVSGLKAVGASDQVIEKFNEKVGPQVYKKDLADRAKKAAGTLQKKSEEIYNTLNVSEDSSDEDKEKLQKLLDQNKGKAGWNSTKQYLNKIAGRGKKEDGPPPTKEQIVEYLKKQQTGIKGTGDNSKIIGKLAKLVDRDGAYKDMKQADIDATKNLLDTMKDSHIKDAMKGNILAGMHLESILGIDENPNLDKFMVSYGIQPNGAQMNEATLMDLIPELGGKKGLMEMSEQYSEDKTDEEKKAIHDKIMQASKDHMEVDFKEGASSGTINIVHKENGKTSKFPLFETRMRSRPIGAAPVLEIHQTNFMAVALSRDDDGNQLGTNVDRWPPSNARKYYEGEIKRLEDELKDDPTPEQKDALEQDKKEKEDKLKDLPEGYQSLEGMIHRMYNA